MFSGELAQIDSRYREKIQFAFAQSTQNNFKYQCVSFLNFCAKHNFLVMPLDYSVIARYLTVCSDQVSAYGTIMNKLSALTKFYSFMGVTLDPKHPLIDMLIKSCKRQMSSESKPKVALEPGHIILISQVLDPSSLLHRLFHVALLVQFFTCVRKSNLLPPSLRAFSVHKHLTRGDLHFAADSIIVSLPWTKTMQNADNIMTIPIAKVNNALLDPVSTYKLFSQQFPMPPNFPAFSLHDGHKVLVLTQQTYIDILKDSLNKLGLPYQAFSSHSVRRGGTTTMARAQVPHKLIKHHGGWRSSCYERYIQVSHKDKLLPTQKMIQYINDNYS